MTEKDEERFWAKVDKKGPDDCWPWTAHCSPKGYGQFRLEGNTLTVHRLAFEMMTGQKLGELQCLHSCDNPPCVNPKHLRAGTHADNMKDRGDRNRTANAENGRSYPSQKTHCPRGHLYDEENTKNRSRNTRDCLTCHRERAQVWRNANREKYNAYMREYNRR